MTDQFNVVFQSHYDFLATDLIVLNRRIRGVKDGEVVKVCVCKFVGRDEPKFTPLFTELQLDNLSSITPAQLDWEKSLVKATIMNRPAYDNEVLHIPLCKFVIMKAVDFAQIPMDYPDVGIVRVGSDVEGLTYTIFVENIKAGYANYQTMLNKLWTNHSDAIRNSMLLYMK